MWRERELEMMWMACIKRLKVSGMIWLLVEDDVDVLHVEIKLEMTWTACIKWLKVKWYDMTISAR